MTDAITLRGIEFLGTHGATEEERIRKQKFAVDLRVELSLEDSAKSDRLSDTIDYRDLGHIVTEAGTKGRYHLLEALAGQIASDVQSRWPAARVSVSIRKLQPPVDFAVESIEVQIHRAPRRS